MTRMIRNKATGRTEKQWAHMPVNVGGTQYVFLPLNDLWEVVQ
jgi:hypothetical protein